MPSKYISKLLLLLCLMYFYTSNGQVYAPDTTFKKDIIPVGEKINFLHKIDEQTYYIGTNTYDDGNKPLIKNLYTVNLSGEFLNTQKDINLILVDANRDKILLTNIDGTFLFENQKLRFIDKRKSFDVNWNNKEILINDSGKVKILDFNGTELYNPNIQANKGYHYESVFYFNNDTLISVENQKLIVFNKKGVKLISSDEIVLPNTILFGALLANLFFNINSKFIGLNVFKYDYPFYVNYLTIFDINGKVILNNSKNQYSRIIFNDNLHSVIQTRKNGYESSNYSFYNDNFDLIKNKTLFGDNYRKLIAFEDYFLATDGNKIYRLSTKNSAYIEAILPDTVEINDKPIKISTKTIGNAEKVNISCDCNLIKNDTLYPKKAGFYKITFKTNSGLVLNKTITVKKRIDSVSFIDFKDIYLTELPLKFTLKSKSGLPVKLNFDGEDLGYISDGLITKKDLAFYYRNGNFRFDSISINLKLATDGNEIYDTYTKLIPIKITGIKSLFDFENQKELFILYPNPNLDKNIKVLFLTKEYPMNPQIKLTDIFGKETIIREQDILFDNISELTIPENIASGLYFLTVQLGDKIETKKIIIK